MMKRNIHALEVSDSIIQGLYKQCLLPDGTKPFIWTSVDLSSERSSGIRHLTAISQEIPHSSIAKVITFLNFPSNLSGTNELISSFRLHNGVARGAKSQADGVCSSQLRDEALWWIFQEAVQEKGGCLRLVELINSLRPGDAYNYYYIHQ